MSILWGVAAAFTLLAAFDLGRKAYPLAVMDAVLAAVMVLGAKGWM